MRSDAFHAADYLMTRNHRVSVIVPVISDMVHIRMTYAAVEDVDDDVVWAWIATLKAIGGQRSLGSRCSITKNIHGHGPFLRGNLRAA
jgi:hypothetical protein